MNQENLKKLVLALLSDENGVNEESYMLIHEMCGDESWYKSLRIDATDGRFYINLADLYPLLAIRT